MVSIADQSNMPVWDIPWSALALLASLAALLLLVGLCRAGARPAPKYAPPAQDTPEPVPAGATTLTREQQQCFQRGHVYTDWAKTDTHWICARCEHQVPRVTASSTFDEHAAQALAITNGEPEPDPDDEIALCDLALWEIESGWATS
jgi:hypothetical protein